MTLVFSIVLALIPLVGIVWILTSGSLETVDGLFTSLILLSLSGILLLNAFFEARERGLVKLPRKRREAPVTTAKTGSVAPAAKTPEVVSGAKPQVPAAKTETKPSEVPAQKTT